jgi:hypothetical protein
MNRVHVFVRCYVDHQMAPARTALVTSCAAPRSFPVRVSPYHLRIMSTICSRTTILLMPQWRYRQSVVAGVGLDSRREATLVDARVVRAQTRQADWHTGVHLPGAPRDHWIAVAAADVRRIGATDFGTAKLNFGHLCYLPEVRAPRDTGRRKFGPTEFPHPAISADAWAGAA